MIASSLEGLHYNNTHGRMRPSIQSQGYGNPGDCFSLVDKLVVFFIISNVAYDI